MRYETTYYALYGHFLRVSFGAAFGGASRHPSIPPIVPRRRRGTVRSLHRSGRVQGAGQFIALHRLGEKSIPCSVSYRWCIYHVLN